MTSEPTGEELREIAAEKRRQRPTSTQISKAVMDEVFATMTRECGDHGFVQSKIAGAWRPLVCPTCNPPTAPSALPAPGSPAAYEGDILEDLHDAGVNAWKYRDATLDSFDSSSDQGAMNAARHYLSSWKNRRGRFTPRDWMYLFGAGSDRSNRGVTIGRTGNGKTFLAVAIARELVETGLLSPRRLGFATAETILLESEATFRTNAEDSEIKLLRRYERLDLLIIDDFGVRDASPHAIRLFDELTKRRECRATIWTSNLSLRVLAGGAEYLKRITSRIAGESGDGGRYVVEFHGPDRRLQRGRRSSVA